MLIVGRERGKGRRKIHSPFHLCMRIPEWHSLCWLVESERGEKERRKVALSEKETESFRDSWSCPPFILKSINTGPSDLVSIRHHWSKQVSEHSYLSSHLF
jgi:hypothetical protein